MYRSHSTISGNSRPWLPPTAPMRLMLGAMVLVLIQGLLALEWQRQQPFFALPLTLHKGQLQLTSADQPLQTAHAIELGGQRLLLTADLRIPDPDYFSRFADLNDFLARQQTLHAQLSQADSATLLTPNGGQHHFPRQTKHWTQIPVEFWIYQAFGALALLVGTAFWAFHRSQPTTRILALAGLGFALMEWTMSLYATRELALAEATFRHLLALNHFGGMLFASSCVGLLMFQPVARPMPWLLWAGGIGNLLCWGNEILQGVEWPGNVFYFPTLLLLPTFVLLALRQSRLCQQQPRQRAQLRWLVATLLGGLGLAFTLYVIPLLLERPTWLSLLQANLIVLLVFIGFVLGAQRSELFGIHRWWLRSWIVSGAVLVLVSADALALLTFHQASMELGLLTMALSWLYLPLRQWCWHRALGHCQPVAEESHPLLPTLVDQFNPLHVQSSPCPPTQADIEMGLVLALPVTSNHWWIFTGKSRGFGLFTAQDQAHAEAQLQEAGAPGVLLQQERERIMRDLHDDVAADLLTLLHQAEDESRRHLVRETLGNLRSIIYSLQPEQARPLRELTHAWHEDCLRRCRAADVRLDWQDSGDDKIGGDLSLSPVQALHMHRLLREAVSNALRHAHPQMIQIELKRDRDHLLLQVTDDGNHTPLHQWLPGKGLHNLRQRAHELDGLVRWQLRRQANTQVCEFSVRIPLIHFCSTATPLFQHDPARKPDHAEHLAA